ncbi:ABC opine/polyamine transporter periplasmic binding protein [Azorhizobium caulinodans ORS 571]|uniref:ABC opine/polyamine transporter periplasmic binding protein n=1 Tax=Azorhizobium caulinodans (strain ATCC 43989 / DSM 5975 / JCM 20966 / LMG 6465 / NBRC 14845 / NCIMB 13405 / ORS 571) TaxID=438753 RepID=A8I525_AZOC5|nr:ABC transporter substrate-binding protein [Azorhizobium caulinodans]BAF87800.1 ABC opine/polyamine transporter periplasmic binding protein [Azorhizobium caulinodans ORS 571]
MTTSAKFGAAAALALGLFSQAAWAESNITVMAYSGLFQERYTKAVIEPFMKAHPDIKVTYFPLPSSAAMLGNLRAQKAAPQTDVAIMDVSVSKAGTDEGLFTKIDETNAPNVKDLYPNARIPDVAGVAVTFDNLVMLYNTDQVKEPPKSWMAMADKGYAGKVVIPGMPDIQGLSLVIILNKANGGTDYLKDVSKGIAAMVEIAPNVQTWEPKPEVYAPIVTGQAAVGAGWNARAQVNSQTSGGKLKATIPQEGTVFQINTINLVANGPGGDAAKTFVNYALSPEAQKAFTESMFYAPTNAKADISPEALDRTAVKFMDKVIPVDWIALAKVRDAIGEQWRRRVLPASR